MSQSDTLKNELSQLLAKGKSRTFAIAMVADKHNISENEVTKVYNSLELSQKSSQDLEALVRTMREHLDSGLSRNELVVKMSKASGYSESTANHMLSQLNFAKEYAKQVNK